eukprot:832531_1
MSTMDRVYFYVYSLGFAFQNEKMKQRNTSCSIRWYPFGKAQAMNGTTQEQMNGLFNICAQHTNTDRFYVMHGDYPLVFCDGILEYREREKEMQLQEEEMIKHLKRKGTQQLIMFVNWRKEIDKRW